MRFILQTYTQPFNKREPECKQVTLPDNIFELSSSTSSIAYSSPYNYVSEEQEDHPITIYKATRQDIQSNYYLYKGPYISCFGGGGSSGGGGGTSDVKVLNDLLDVFADSLVLEGDRYLRFDPETNNWYAVLLDFVESVQGYTGDVILSTNDIPETDQRRYFNRTNFLNEAGFSNLNIFKDVEYDTSIYDGNVLMWDGSVNKWTPRPPLANIRLGDLTDIIIDPNYPFYSACHNHTVRKSEYDEEENNYNLIDTHQKDYDHWVLHFDCGDAVWYPRQGTHFLGKRFLEDFQNVAGNAEGGVIVPGGERQPINIPYLDGTGSVQYERKHGRALMWDENIFQWRPGGYVELETSDDLVEGSLHLYLTDDNLPVVANRSLSLGNLEDVDNEIVGFNPSNQPAAKVLGWSPAENRWQAVNALTDDVTTSNIPEHDYKPFDPPLDPTQPNQRLYFSVDRVRESLGFYKPGDSNAYGRLDWFGEVQYAYGLSHGQSLVWDEGIKRWVAGNPTSAVNTDYLPEGNTNLYYTNQRVKDWTDTNIKRVGLNYFYNVSVNEPPTDPNHAIVWDADIGRWVSGYPIALPLTSRGDILIGKGGEGTNPTDYGVVGLNVAGKYFRVDPTKEYGAGWADPDPIYKQRVQYPDIPHLKFTRSKDTTGLGWYLGTEYGTGGRDDYSAPTAYIALSALNAGTNLNYLINRTYYSTVPSSNPPDTESSNATSHTVSTNGILVDFKSPNAFRLEEMVVQARATGTKFFKVYVSHNGTTWTELKEKDSNEAYQFELSSEMFSQYRTGRNSSIVDSNTVLNTRFFYKIRSPFYEASLTDDGAAASNFWRYLKIEPFSGTGVIEIVEIEFYGKYNTGVEFHVIKAVDSDYVLISGMNNLEIILPGSALDIQEVGIGYTFHCIVVSDEGHTTEIYTDQIGRVYNNVSSNAIPTKTEPIIVPPRTMAHIIYAGEGTDNNSSVVKWYVNVIGAGGAGGGGEVDYNYILDRANHFGKQPATSLTGLAAVALSNNYNDLNNLPIFSGVAYSGSYGDLANRPTLGTAAALNVGTQPLNVVQLTNQGKLPALDGSLLTNLSVDIEITSPLTTKGDIYIRSSSGDARLPVGANGYVLTADSSVAAGLSWQPVENSTTDADLLDGLDSTYYLNRANHVGSIPVGAVTGLASVATTNSYTSLINKPTFGTAALYNVGTDANQVVVLSSSNTLPALDGSNLYNIGSPLTALGDLMVRGVGVDARLPIGTDGQVLTVDSTQPLGLKWKTSAVTNALYLDGYSLSQVLDRSNHTGTISPSSISGLASVATTGDYNDLINAPNLNLAVVASTGRYADLLGTPVLGTASTLDVGLNPYNVVQLDATGNLPSTLRESLGTPTTTQGDLIARGLTADTRLPIGSDGQILSVDPTEETKLKWVDPPEEITFPFALKGDILAYDGTNIVKITKGAESTVLTVTNQGATGLEWKAPTEGGVMYRVDYDSDDDGVVDLAARIEGATSAGVSTYYGKDAANNVGFHPLPVNSPLTSKGDIYAHNGSSNTRLPIGSANQVLLADPSSPTGLRWSSTAPSSGEVTPEYITTPAATPLANTLCLLDTTSNTISITLPDSPPNGTKMVFVDYASNFSTNPVTISPSGSDTIKGYSSLYLSSSNSTIQLIYWDSRWVVYGSEIVYTTLDGGEF